MKIHEPGSFGELLKKFRSDPTRWDEKPPSQAKLADWLHVSVDTIQSYEQNKRFPDLVILGALAKVLNLTESEQSELTSALRSTKEARRRRKAVDTTQTSLHPLENNETVPSVPRDPTEATTPSRTRWKLIRNVAFILLAVSFLVFAAYTLIIRPRLYGSISPQIPGSSIKPVLVSGKVLCANNGPVIAIWFDVFKNGKIDKSISGYADLRTPNSNGSEVAFEYVLKGYAYNLHVGCGGSTQKWKGVYITELGTGPIHDHKYHYFICHGIPPAIDYGPCELQY